MFARPHIVLILGALLILAGSVSAASDWKIVKIGGREYLTVDNVAQFYALPTGVAPIEKRIRLDNGKNSLELQLDSRDGAHPERGTALLSEDILARCHGQANCTDVCPMEISPTDSILALRRRAVLRLFGVSPR